MKEKSDGYQIDETSIEDISLLEPAGTYSYADYLRWTFEERVELIKGQLFRMSPGPNTQHQAISRNLFVEIGQFLKKKKCQTFAAPFDVRFPEKTGLSAKETFTVVQPDICVICNPQIIDEAGCNGAPDLIVEILSPSTSRKDLTHKFQLYEEFKVREYWIVYPGEEILEIFYLESGEYSRSKKFVVGDKIESKVLADMDLSSSMVFEDL